MSNVAIDLTKTVKEIITKMKTAIDNLNTDVSNLKGQILQSVYPVGSVYVSITDSRNPADILGFGTWIALPAGYGLVAQGTATAEDGSTLTFTAGEKSGEFKHQLTVGELPNHSHTVYTDPNFCAVNTGNNNEWKQALANAGTPASGVSYGCYIGAVGYNYYHNNISPSIAIYLWRRTA